MNGPQTSYDYSPQSQTVLRNYWAHIAELYSSAKLFVVVTVDRDMYAQPRLSLTAYYVTPATPLDGAQWG